VLNIAAEKEWEQRQEQALADDMHRRLFALGSQPLQALDNPQRPNMSPMLRQEVRIYTGDMYESFHRRLSSS
jgi:hypothetical protein